MSAYNTTEDFQDKWMEAADRTWRENMTEKFVFALLISGNKVQLQKLDGIYQAAKTAIRFGDYRRAAQYLLLFLTLCRRENNVYYQNVLQSKYMLERVKLR